MKKSILIALATITLFACNPNKNETTSTTDDAGMSDFKENSKVILDGFEKPKGPIIEPFAGQGDLIDWLGRCDVESYDIEPKRNDIIERDTLINPPSYGNKWVITNPPYLARNKCDSKQIFDMYKTNDLYKCFIMSVVNQNEKCFGGIFIIPVGYVHAD